MDAPPPTGIATALIVHQRKPLNAEPPLGRLGAGFLTAPDDFYIRTHGTIPGLDASAHRLRLTGKLAQPQELTLQDLRTRFPRQTVTATLQCAGNRRGELDHVRPVDGAKWRAGAIGTATWTGVSLAAVLRAAGCDADPSLHVAFEALDTIEQDGRSFAYGASIPLAKAMAPEVMLALDMDGAPLRPEHGFPLRLVVPGQIGARSVKWIGTIRVQDTPSDNHYQQQEYRLLPADMGKDNLDPAAGIMLHELPVNAAICAPEDGATLPAGTVSLRGYALSGGRSIERVEVSADHGGSWVRATLESQPGDPWAWTLWQARLDLPAGRHTLAVRAWDAAGQTQPERLESVWNWKGYLNTAWHRVVIHCR